MTIPTNTSAIRYTGNGATSAYAYTMKIQDDDDLEVSVTTTADVNTVLTKTTHYTVSGVGDSAGGTVTLISPYNNLTTDYILTIRLKPALNNSTSFATSSKVTTRALADAADRLSQRDIRQQDELDRCIKLPVWEAGSAAKTELGDAASRASKYLGFDSSGNPTLSSAVAAGSLSVTSIGETIVEAANAGAVLDAIGFTTFTKTIVDDTTAGAVLTTLGVSALAQTILDDTTAAAVRTTIGLDAASGAIASLDIADAATAQIFQARLTLTTALAVTTADVTAAGTIYLTPYKGNKIAVYNGTRWKLMPLTEISLALTATSGKPYDVWVYDNSGTLTLETTVWTNDSTRATALALQDGVYCKTGALTRRYVGSFYASGANQTTDSYLKRYVWNNHNRVSKGLRRTVDTGYTYTTAAFRQANNNTDNQVDVMIGVSEDAIHVGFVTNSANSSANVIRGTGIGLDSTSSRYAYDNGIQGTSVSPANQVFQHSMNIHDVFAAGRHFFAALEYSVATGTTTWSDGTGLSAGYMFGEIPC